MIRRAAIFSLSARRTALKNETETLLFLPFAAYPIL